MFLQCAGEVSSITYDHGFETSPHEVFAYGIRILSLSKPHTESNRMHRAPHLRSRTRRMTCLKVHITS